MLGYIREDVQMPCLKKRGKGKQTARDASISVARDAKSAAAFFHPEGRAYHV
jgi:hypothetical protein